MELLLLFGFLLVSVNAGTYGGQQTSLEDIERDYSNGQKSTSYTQLIKTKSSPASAPTKFGFVPQRTASSYAATKPKHQYTQTHYQVKKPSGTTQPTQYQQQYTTQYTQSRPQVAFQQQYSVGSNEQYAQSEKYSNGQDYSQQYSIDSQQYFSQQKPQNYAYVQPESPQQYSVPYQQPTTQYDQYENVQYVADNSIAQPDSRQYYTQQPQYYYVQQQYQSPSTAVESVLDPKGVQYVMVIPSYTTNSIPIDSKYQEQYTTSTQQQLPSITTTVAKYTTVESNKSSIGKESTAQYVSPASTKAQYQQQQGITIKREPKSLLDSYVPSILQLQYLKQHGKSSFANY